MPADQALMTRLTQQHRSQQLAVRARSVSGLLSLWRVVDPADLSGTIDTFVNAAVLLSDRGNRESSALAARYYRTFRRAAGLLGAAPVVPLTAGALADDVAAGELRGAALSGIINARRAGQDLAAAKSNGLVKVTGQLIKQVLTGGRMVILSSVDADPKALGWRRYGGASPCQLCRSIIARGTTFGSRRAADFETHGGCSCTAGAVFDDRPDPEQEKYAKQYRDAQIWAKANIDRTVRTSNDPLNNLRRYVEAGAPPVT